MSAHSEPAVVASSTREAILSAAERVIRERSVTATTTRLIAEAAGCSEGTIYNHFASKDELVSHVVCERLASFPDRALALPELAGVGEVEANLAELVDSAIAFFAELSPLMAAAMADPDALRERAAALDEAGRGPRWIIAALVSYLQREQQLGRVAAHAHVHGAALALVGGAWHQAHVAEVWQVDVLDADPDADAATEIAAAVMTGLRP